MALEFGSTDYPVQLQRLRSILRFGALLQFHPGPMEIGIDPKKISYNNNLLTIEPISSPRFKRDALLVYFTLATLSEKPFITATVGESFDLVLTGLTISLPTFPKVLEQAGEGA